MDLQHAIEAHANWKTKLRAAISNGEQMDAATISKDNCCELGKWLYGDGKKQFGTLAAFQDCTAKHAAFHTEAGKVAQLINKGEYEKAEGMLGAGTPYAAASTATGVAITKLRKEAGI
ncbi:CZB domain-containing protein [Burkholderiaceae bacterium DAT-1]|nr:CZB domain-containing protein [Burkholderiaceae bacterium DAT-1]